MIKKLLMYSLFIAPIACNSKALEKIVLTSENSISLRMPVTDKTVAQLSQELLELSENAPKDKPLYLIQYTPGGSIAAGLSFIAVAKSIPQEVKTINIFSASMGFQIAQNLGERLVVENSIMMSHLAYGGTEGTIPGSIQTSLDVWYKIIYDLDVTASSRMKTSLKSYRSSIQNELWVYGNDNLKFHLADRMVKVSCGKSLQGTKEDVYNTMFGPVTVVRSKCPMITGILDVRAEGSSVSTFNNSDLQRALFLLNSNVVQFTKEFIVNGKFNTLGL